LTIFSFQEILTKINDLLYKLKSFNDVDFNPMATKGILLTMTNILQQDHTLTSYQILLHGIQTLAQSTKSLAAMRLGHVLKFPVSAKKLHAFTM